MSATKSHSLSIGIVGIPNAGKSTLFNSLTQNAVPAENFPFCTIDKNVGVVEVPDPRLAKMVELYSPEKTVPSAITFVDIAGLVKGASEGEGLGNQFLSHIREVDVIMYVLRAFKSDSISHVYDRIDPWEDYQIVQTELILKDLDTVSKRQSEVNKRARVSNDKVIQMQSALLNRLMEALGDGIPAHDVKMNDDEKEFAHDLWLLSMKKRLFVLNVKEGSGEDTDAIVSAFQEKAVAAGQNDEIVLKADVKIIGEMLEMNETEKAEFIELLETKPLLSEDVIEAAYRCLDLITFYTGSETECNAWSIVRGATAKEAAGVIHTDLSAGFITADIVNVEKLVEAGGFHEAKEKAYVRNHGKTYIVQDGDYMVVLAN